MTERKHGHYFKDVSGIAEIDVYRVLRLYDVEDQAIAHAIKKLLVCGARGVKDKSRDVQEAIDTLLRWQEIEREDEQQRLGLCDPKSGDVQVTYSSPIKMKPRDVRDRYSELFDE